MKQPIPINFSQGVDNKTDPWQIPMGKFTSLVNSIFQKGGLLQKRNGYGLLSKFTNPSYITTLNGNLMSVGSTVGAYSSSLGKWITKGNLQPCSLSVMPLIRNNLNQTQSDTAISNNLACVVFTETNSINSGLVTQYLFAINDATTGQNISPPTALPVLTGGAISGSSRVFVVGNFFVIVSPVIVSSVPYLQYFSIPTSNPVNTTTNAAIVSAAQNVTGESYAPISTNPGWDGISVNNSSNNVLVVAYNTTVGGQGVHVASLTAQQVAANQSSSVIKAFSNSAYIGALVSVCVDLTVSPNIFYVSFWNNSTSNGYTCAVYLGLGSVTQQFAPVQTITSTTILNLASAAQNGGALLFSEVSNNYSYDSSIPTHYINGVTISSSGSVGTQYVVQRSVGLASKAFVVSGSIYFLAAYQSTFQPSYFLINGSLCVAASPVIVATLATLNGGGYLTLGLPNVSISGTTASMSYFYKDDVEALNTLNNTQQTTAGGIYSQVGINLVNFTIGTSNIDTSEAAQNLMLSGGYLGQFDGYLPVENNFFIWPDNVECVYTEVSTVTPTGTFSSGSNTIVVSSATGIYPGMTITDTTHGYIPANTSVTYVNGTTVTISNKTTGAGTSDALSIQGNIADIPTGGTQNTINYYYQVVYEWTDNQGLAYRSQPSIPVAVTTTGTTSTGITTINVPTLRLTQKTANPVKIVIYRWSEFTQVYNQVTSITAPLLNSTTTDSVTFVDTLSDANVQGNNLLYTTGGVVNDTAAPSTSIMTQFDTRLWLVDAEDPNTLWCSKQLIESTPVEMSNEFTIYVAPNIGTTSSTGPITALAPMDDKLIVFKKDAIYYINGTGPNNLGTTSVGCPLGNYSQPTFVTSVVGCNNQQSIVLTSDGLMFSSDKGIWLLGRDLSTSYIGAPVENYNSYTVNSAQIVPGTNYVVFTLTGTNVSLMYDYYYQQWGTFVGPYAISSCIYQNLHTLIDKYGNILQETPGAYLDGADPVLMSFLTNWISFAGLQGYQRFYEFQMLAKYISPHFLVCQVAYDYNPSPLNQKIINPTNYSPATPGPFGVPTPFGAANNVEQWRIHAKKQTCESFQLTVNEVFNASYGTIPGAGLTMSGLICLVDVKRPTRPISGSHSTGVY